MRPSARPPRRTPIRVAVADHHRAFAEALRIALSRVRGVRVTAVTDNVEGLAAGIRARGADVVLVDDALAADGAHSGDGAICTLKDADAHLRVLILATSEEEGTLVRAAERGADGVLARSRPLRDVVRAIQALSRGDALLDPDVIRRSAVRRRQRREDHAALGERLRRLTAREVEILQHLADGLPPDEIAEVLGISPNTLRTHVQNVLMKLRVHSKLEAVTAAIRHGRVHVRRDVTVDVERRVLDLAASGSRGEAYAAGTSGSTSGGRSGRGRSRGSSR